MDSGKAREIFTSYSTAMAYVAVELPNKDSGIGSAFHVGKGVFLTARHVVEGNQIVQIGSTEHAHVRLEGAEAENAGLFIHSGDDQYPAHEVNNEYYSKPRVIEKKNSARAALYASR